MTFLVPNYSCIQKPWLGGLKPPDPSSLCPLSSAEFVETPPRKKILGTPLILKMIAYTRLSNSTAIYRYCAYTRAILDTRYEQNLQASKIYINLHNLHKCFIARICNSPKKNNVVTKVGFSKKVELRKPGESDELVHNCPLFKADSQRHNLNTGLIQRSGIQRRRQVRIVYV